MFFLLSGRWHLGERIWEETSGRRHLVGDIWKKAPGRLWDRSWGALRGLLDWELWRLWRLQGCLVRSIFIKWHHSATVCKSSLSLFILRSVFEGTTHQVRSRATFARWRLQPRSAGGTKMLHLFIRNGQWQPVKVRWEMANGEWQMKNCKHLDDKYESLATLASHAAGGWMAKRPHVRK